MLTCETIKEGKDCLFATKNGCFFIDGHCDPVVEQCDGCDKIEEWPTGKYCSTCPSPPRKWINYKCNYASHIKETESKTVKHVDPVKASKRQMKGEGSST